MAPTPHLIALPITNALVSFAISAVFIIFAAAVEELSGDRLESSLYSVNTLQTQHCRLVCAPRLYSRREMSRFSEKIADSYRVNWVLDNLPAVTKYWVRRRGG